MHVDNLGVCLGRGALHAPNYVPNDGLPYRTIHRIDVQGKRRVHEIRRGPGGTIHDYVAFYFGPRSVMLYQLQTGWVGGYDEGQEPLIHLMSTCQAIEAAGRRYVFADGHGLARFTDWYDDLGQLGEVDWEAVYARHWHDTREDMDRQRRKQAEFLVHRSCPIDLITGIGVYNAAARDRVEAELEIRGVTRTVAVHPEWYY
jgi:hypothetical protein